MTSAATTKVLHFGTDRIRISAPLLRQSPQLAERFESVLGRAAGMRKVAFNPLTGNLLLEFDSSAWRTPEGTRALFSVLAELLPNYCSSESLAIPWGDSAATHDSVLRAVASAPGVTGIRDDSAASILHVHFDPHRFAVEPVLQALLGHA